MLPEVKTITWRDLFGNKYNKALHPAMLFDEGYETLVRVRKIGEPGKDAFNVIYDRQYAIEFISRKVCRPLSHLGKEKVLEAIEDAWSLYLKESIHPHSINRPKD